MNIEKWLDKNTSSLSGKTVALTGSTGGIGRELCIYLLKLGASLILLDRNKSKSDDLCTLLRAEFEGAEIQQMTLDLEDMENVKEVCEELKKEDLFALIHNSGAYSIPRHKCTTGFDNVFQINFVSPYYMTSTLMPNIQKNGGRVVIVGSIAHTYSKTDLDDIDFSKRKKASLVYGNAKRFLMFSSFEKAERDGYRITVTHPGITFTGITAHYPKFIFALIKHPMKVIFMKPRKACLSILAGLFVSPEHKSWIGPAFFDIWGLPKKKILKTVTKEEGERIYETAEAILRGL
ncbi:MAG: SDR family NAD(P)-dependent oxidoreductase [Clostridia bacterium]|nr:SDR family NAD(P)-dependent oxidoreductase [Clostridia bacterium]